MTQIRFRSPYRVALPNGAAIYWYAPDGSLLTSVQLPVEQPTSCAFGGSRRDTPFVTTARTDLDDDALTPQPHAGKVFAIDGLGARGLPACRTAAGHDGRLSVRGPGGGPAQARILAFSRSNSSAVMTPRSRRSASLASWSAGLCEPAASWT